jgi:hypothetical protein
MEAGSEPQHRTQVNLYAGFCGMGECAFQHDARNPNVTVGVMEAGAAGHFSTLPQEISIDPTLVGRVRGGDDECLMSVEKSDHSILVLKLVNAGGAKGVTS